MDNSLLNDENAPRNNMPQNEKRKPLESPFSAFSPAQRLAKKKGRILCEPGDSNLEASMMEESILHADHTDSTKPLRPKKLFGEGDGGNDDDDDDDDETEDSLLDHTTIDPTQVDGDRTFSAETRPFVPDEVDPNLDQTYADMTMNQTFSHVVCPSVPSSVDPNLDETLADMTLNETFSNVVRPLVPSSIDPNMDETLAETTINETQYSVEESMFVMAGNEDDFPDDADRTLGESNEEEIGKIEKEGNSILDELDAEKEDNGGGTLGEGKTEMGLISPNKSQGVSLFEEMNTIKLTVPIDLCVKDEEDSVVEASQENSLMKEGGESREASLFDELNTHEKEEMSMNGSRIENEGVSLFDEMNGSDDDCEMDESVMSTMTAMGMSGGEARRLFYTDMKKRLSQHDISTIAPKTPEETSKMDTKMSPRTPSTIQQNDDEDQCTPTQMVGMISPASQISNGTYMNNTLFDSPSTPSKPSRYNMMNDSHLSFIMHEAEVTNSVYTELKREMKVLQDELSKSRENTEKVEKERDNAKKEAEDYVFMMELQKKKMMGDKSDLSRRLFELENELSEARRMSNVVEEEGRKVEEMERIKMELEEEKKRLEDKIIEENEKYAVEMKRLSDKTEEMERQIEDERKKANEEMERRLVECRIEMERRIEEILIQKNELITQLEKMECESGEKEYTNEENERKLEGEKAMMEATMSNLLREKKEMEDELERVKIERDEAIRKMTEVGAECEGIKNSIREIDELRNAAFEDSRIANGEVEELKRVNKEMKEGLEEIKRNMEEKEKEVVSLQSRISVFTASEGRIGEMEEKINELEEEKNEKLTEMEGVIEEMKNGLEEKQKEIDSLQSKISVFIAAEGKMGEMEEKINELEKENNDKIREMEGLIEEMTKGMEEKQKEIVSLQSNVSVFTASEGIRGEMEERIKELEKEKNESDMIIKGMKMEKEMSGNMESRMEELMEKLMKKTEEHYKEKESLHEEMIELKRKNMESEMEMKTKEKELESSEMIRKRMEEDIEKMREEGRDKIESMESIYNSLKKEFDEMKHSLAVANENTLRLESKLRVTEEESAKKMIEMETEKEKEMNEIMMEVKRMKDQMMTMNNEKTNMEEELEKKKEEIELIKNEIENEKMRSAEKNESEDAIREMKNVMEESRQRMDHAESALTLMTTQKEEMERRMMEVVGQKEEIMRMMEEMKKEKEEMRMRMEKENEIEMEKESSIQQLNEAMKNVQIQLDNEREEKKMMTLRLNEMENEKMESEKKIEAERERNDILSATVRQLEDEVDRVTVNGGVNGGIDEGQKIRLEEELKEEKENVMRLKKEIKRLEDECDNFDDIEYKLKLDCLEKQKRIDALEGKAKTVGPSLLDALKPTKNEIKSMNETVVDPKPSPSPSREVAGKEEKEDEDMKEEYGTPSGSIMEEEDRKDELMSGEADETLGVTKIDATRYDVDDEEYEQTNQTRPNSSCRQS
uniref:Uncharacterized protein n=1 Tax=Pristionchus pacificus TaxID=54126 RepID=A0A8R1U3L5_PRIPA